MIISKYDLFYGDATYDILHVAPSTSFDAAKRNLFILHKPQDLLFLRVANVNTLIFLFENFMYLRKYISHLKKIIPNVNKIIIAVKYFEYALGECNINTKMDVLKILKHLFYNKHIEISMDKYPNTYPGTNVIISTTNVITIINKKIRKVDKSSVQKLADELIKQDEEIEKKQEKYNDYIEDHNQFQNKVNYMLHVIDTLRSTNEIKIESNYARDIYNLIKLVGESIRLDYTNVYNSLKITSDEYFNIIDERYYDIIDILVRREHIVYDIDKELITYLKQTHAKKMTEKVEEIQEKINKLIESNEIQITFPTLNFTSMINDLIIYDYTRQSNRKYISANEYFDDYYKPEIIIEMLFYYRYIKYSKTIKNQFDTQFLKQQQYIINTLKSMANYDINLIRFVLFEEFDNYYKIKKLSLRDYYLQFNEKIFDEWINPNDISAYNNKDIFNLLLIFIAAAHEYKQQTFTDHDILKDAYKFLDIPRDASIPEIKKAYKKLSFLYHPDKNPDNREYAEEQFKKLGIAYDAIRKHKAFMKKRNIY